MPNKAYKYRVPLPDGREAEVWSQAPVAAVVLVRKGPASRWAVWSKHQFISGANGKRDALLRSGEFAEARVEKKLRKI